MTQASLHRITIVHEDREADIGAKGLRSAATELVRRVGSVDPEVLRDNLQTFCAVICDALQGVETSIRAYPLKTVEVSAEVTAQGEIRLVGGASVGVKGGLRLVFEREAEEG